MLLVTTSTPLIPQVYTAVSLLLIIQSISQENWRVLLFVARVVLQRRVLCCNSWFAVTTESKVSFSFTSSHSAFLLNTMSSVCFMSWVKLHVCWNHGNKPSARCSHNRGRLPERYLQYHLTWSFRCITGVNVNTLCDSVDSELTETWVVGCTNQAPPSSSG